MPHCSQLHFQHSTLRGQHLGSTIRQARACKSINSTARCCRLTALKASSTSTSNTLMLQHHQQQQRQLAGQCRRHHDSRAAAAARPQLRCRAVPTASPAVDPYTQVAQLCAAEGPVVVGQTPRGRGLVVSEDMPEREALLTVPLHHALIIADEPTSGISIFSDKQHRRWQEVHGPLPPLLLEFLQGEGVLVRVAGAQAAAQGADAFLCVQLQWTQHSIAHTQHSAPSTHLHVSTHLPKQVMRVGTHAWPPGCCGWSSTQVHCGAPTCPCCPLSQTCAASSTTHRQS